MATFDELKDAYSKAVEIGDRESARILLAAINRAEQDPTRFIPEQEVTTPVRQETSAMDVVKGVGEAGLSAVTGATGGAVGYIAGATKGLAEQLLSGEFGTVDASDKVREAAMKGAESLTYIPRTESGQKIIQTVGDVAGDVLPALPLTAEFQGLSSAVRSASTPVAAQAGSMIGKVAESTRPMIDKASQLMQRTPEFQGAKSMGAAELSQAEKARGLAGELPVSMEDMTLGQATRNFDQIRFERETAKTPEGAPIRERYANQNIKVSQNLDAFIDETGAQIRDDVYGKGVVVEQSLRDLAANSKKKIRALYKEAEKAGETEEPVTLDQLINHINENEPEAAIAKILDVAKQKAIKVGAAEMVDGQLVVKPLSLKDAEKLRQSINQSVDESGPNIRQASIMKGLFDSDTEGAGGDKYKAARLARFKYAEDFESIGLVKSILNTKRKSNDRQLAYEQIIDKIASQSTPVDSIVHMRRLLMKSEDGRQAWKEIQGGILESISREVLKGVTRNERGDPIVNVGKLKALIDQMEKNGKLDKFFGKKGAEMLGILRDVSLNIFSDPPGAVNHSNTATVLAGLVDIMISGTSGVPAPVMTIYKTAANQIKSAKIRKKVRQALGEE